MTGRVEAPVQHRGHVAGVAEFAGAGGVGECGNRILPADREGGEVVTQGGPRRLLGQPGVQRVGGGVDPGQ